MLCMSGMGCASFSTVDVHNGMAAEGFYTGLRHETIRGSGVSKDTSFLDIGKTQKRSAPDLSQYIYSFYRFDLSVPLEPDEYMDFGISGGTSVEPKGKSVIPYMVTGGFNYIYDENDRIYRAHISANAGLSATVSRYWGDTGRIADLDIYGVWVGQKPPLFTIGTRLSWAEGMKNSGLFGAMIVKPKGTDIEIEWGITVMNNLWFQNEKTDPYSDMGLAVRYFF